MEKQKSGRTYPENDTETLSNIRFPIIINIERTQQATGIPICISVEFILRMCQIHIY